MLGFKYHREIAFTTNDLAISRAGSAVLGFKYHRDIAFTTIDLAIVCYSVIAMIDVPIPGA